MVRIVLVLRSGGDYSIKDVELISHHIHNTTPGADIYCLHDEAPCKYYIGVEDRVTTMLPMPYRYKGWWSKLNLFSPEMKKYRPFLYMDLDTAVINDVRNIVPTNKDKNEFITIEDFYRPGLGASGIIWVPEHSDKIDKIWENRPKIGSENPKKRMDYYVKETIQEPDSFFGGKGIYSFKPTHKQGEAKWLREIPNSANMICFHGKPRIWKAAEQVEWVRNYVNEYKTYNNL